MKNRLLEGIDKSIRDQVAVRRYSLADLISESYKLLYKTESGSNLRKIAESVINDVKNNPREIDELSREVGIVKELIALTESGKITDQDLCKAPRRRLNESAESQDLVFNYLYDPINNSGEPDEWIGEMRYAIENPKDSASDNLITTWIGDMEIDTGYKATKEEVITAMKKIVDMYESQGAEGERLDDIREDDQVELTDEEKKEVADHLADIAKDAVEDPEPTKNSEVKDAPTKEDDGSSKKSASMNEASGDYRVLQMAMDVAIPANMTEEDLGVASDHGNRRLFKAISEALRECGCEMAGDFISVVDDMTDLYKDNDYEFDLEECITEGSSPQDAASHFQKIAETLVARWADYMDRVQIIEEMSKAIDVAWEEANLDESAEIDKEVGDKVDAPTEEGDLVEKENQDAVEPKDERAPEVDETMTESYKGLSEFSKKSSSKAFYKTFKKLNGKLHEGVALTRQETIDLYKAANSAMTQMSIELEHNPEFLETFRESTSILSSDVARLLESLSKGKAPSKKNMKSLAKFSESLLCEEDHPEYLADFKVVDSKKVGKYEIQVCTFPDEEGFGVQVVEEDGSPLETEEIQDLTYDKFFNTKEEADAVVSKLTNLLDTSKKVNESEEDSVGDTTTDAKGAIASSGDLAGYDEGDVKSEEAEAFDQEYAEERVELHKELEAEHADDEDPEVLEKIAADKDEVLNLDGITDEQVAELTGEEAPVEDEPEEEPTEDEEYSEDDDITDDELEELKSHLQEMRSRRSK